MNKGFFKMFEKYKCSFHNVLWNIEKYPFYIILFLFILIFFNVFRISSLLLLIFIFFFFRKPNRIISNRNDLLLSPCDGLVTQISKVNGRYEIMIFLNIFDPHINRIPCNGKIIKKNYIKGHFDFAFKDNISRNEMSTIIIEEQNHQDHISVSQIAGFLARRIETNIKIGETVVKGKEYGIIYFGSGMKIIFPERYDLIICEMQNVKAGESIIAIIK